MADKETDGMHIFDIARRYRNAESAADRTLERPRFSCVLQGVNVNVTTMEEVRLTPLVTTWSPMFAPTSTPDNAAGVGGNGNVLQDVPNPPWDQINPGPRLKHLAKYPGTAPNFLPRYVHVPSSKLIPTSIWATLPDSAAQPLSASLATYRAWQADIKLGMSLQNLAYLGTLTRDEHKLKSWNPTGWLMNIYTYLLSTDAVRYRSVECLQFWRTPTDHLQIDPVNDTCVVSGYMDHINYDPATLLQVSAADNAVTVGYLPTRFGAGPWHGEVEEADVADFGELFHTQVVNDRNNNATTADCYKSVIGNDMDIVFTTDLQSAITRNPYLANYPKTSIPTAFLDTASTLDQRARRIALWMLGICPCMATAVMSVTETSPLGLTQAEGLMYWNGGTLMSVPQRNMLVVVPIEVFTNIANPSQRLLSAVTFGPRESVACREFGLTNLYLAGDVIAQGTPILRGNVATEAVSASAYVASWQGAFRAEDWTWYLTWIRQHYHCENCLVDAIERVESQIGLLRPGVICDDLNDGHMCYRSGLYEAVVHNADNIMTAYRSPLWDLVVGCDCVIRTRANPREHVIPMFFAELADKIALGFYTLDTKESTIALPTEYFGQDFNHVNALKWNVWTKHVKYDAMFTACGATESMLLRSNTSGFNRCTRNVPGDAAETRMRLPQDQWLTTGDTLWSTLEQNDLKSGWQYMEFVNTSKGYVKHVGALVPSESFMLKPATAKVHTVQGGQAGYFTLLEWHCFGGPYTAPGLPPWIPAAPVLQPYPNNRFRGDLIDADYSLVFHYRYDGVNIAGNFHRVVPASLTAKGLYSWLVHQFFGRTIKPFVATLNGTALPYSAPARLIADSDHDTPYKWLATANNASGTSVDVDFFDYTAWPYEFERDMGVMRQIAGFGNYIITTNRDGRPIYIPNLDLDERSETDSFSVFPCIIDAMPAAGGVFDEAALNLFARRLPRFTTDLRWLYLYSSEAQIRAWWTGQQAHISRPVPLEYALLRMPSLLVTHRGRDRILVDMAARCRPPVAEVHVERNTEPSKQQQETTTRNDKDAPITRPVIADTTGADVSTTLDASTEQLAGSDE